MKQRYLKITFSLIIVLFLLSVSSVQAIQLEEVLIDDGFEGTPWNENWDENLHQWYAQDNVINPLRVRTGTYSAAATHYQEGSFPPAGIPEGPLHGFMVSDPMDTSNAVSIRVEFFFQKSSLEINDFNLTYWDGSDWVLAETLADPAYLNYPNWVNYTQIITDPRFFNSDFRIGFNASLGFTEIARLDDVYVTQVYESQYTLGTYTEGRGAVVLNETGPYDPGKKVLATAVPETGWAFVGWADTLSGMTNPETVTMNRDKIITAVFIKEAPFISVTSASRFSPETTMIFNILYGTHNGQCMIQLNNGSTPVWADQLTLGSSGELTYRIVHQSIWGQGTYTLYIKDVEANKSASRFFSVSPPPPPPPSGGGGGGGSRIPSTFIINLLTPKEASKLLDNFKADDVAEALLKLDNQTHLIKILEQFSPDYAADVIGEMAAEDAVIFLTSMDLESAYLIILEFDQSDSGLIEYMVGDNLEGASILIEEAIKSKIQGLSETERVEVLKQLSEALGSMDKTALVELLVQISQLPETPSTVAYLFESMSLATVLDVVSDWVIEETYVEARPGLANVFSYFSTDLLSIIYRGMAGQERMIFYPYLTVATQESLPEIGEITVSDLEISPSEVGPGEEVTISFTVNNIGDETDDYIITIKIEGETEEIYSGIIENGTSIEISHIIQRSEELVYTVQVDSETGSFEVIEPEPPVIGPEPADLVIVELHVIPQEIIEGEEISVFVTIKNEGDEAGTESFMLQLDSSDFESKDVTLTGGDSTTISFVIADNEIGTHKVSIEDESVEYTVLEKPAQTPWLSIIAVFVFVVAIAGYLYYQRSQS